MHRRSLVTSFVLLATSAFVVGGVGTPVHADPASPPTHFVVHKLMPVSVVPGHPDDWIVGQSIVSGNGRYLLVQSPGSGHAEVLDLLDKVKLGEIDTSSTLQLYPEGIDDTGHVVGSYYDTATDTATAFYWSGASAGHPLGTVDELPVPTSLISSYAPGCKPQFDEDSLYGMSPDGTAYGFAGCGGGSGVFAVSWSVSDGFDLTGGGTGTTGAGGTFQPNAAIADGADENGDIIGLGNIGGSTQLEWSALGGLAPSAIDPPGGGQVATSAMLWRGPQHYVVDGDEIHFGVVNAPFTGTTAVGMNDLGTVFGNSGGSSGGPVVVQAYANDTTTTTLLTDMASVPGGFELTAIIGTDNTGDVFGYGEDAADRPFYWEGVPGAGTAPVSPAPTLAESSPINGHTYAKGELSPAVFSCTAGAGEVLLDTTDGCAMTEGTTALPSDYPLGQLPAGTYTFGFRAKQSDNQQATKTVTFTVTDAKPHVNPPPTITLKSPVNGHVYKKKAKVKASYVCKAGLGTKLSSCKGTVATGTHISTAKVGAHSFTVTAKDADGRVTTKVVHYTVKKKK
ncbi:MAG TPA: hypothetical protein VHZ06_08240 [Marmoricola sp.]|jgi:hypothetical protein|nr:hypothetical protein [Marmoricola sp.]